MPLRCDGRPDGTNPVTRIPSCLKRVVANFDFDDEGRNRDRGECMTYLFAPRLSPSLARRCLLQCRHHAILLPDFLPLGANMAYAPLVTPETLTCPVAFRRSTNVPALQNLLEPIWNASVALHGPLHSIQPSVADRSVGSRCTVLSDDDAGFAVKMKSWIGPPLGSRTNNKLAQPSPLGGHIIQ
jgi:hypothetical protein